MRRILFVAVICISFLAIVSSCTGEADRLAKNKEIVVQANDAINAQDFDKIREFYAPNFVRHCQATPDTVINNLESFINMAKEWWVSFPDAKQTIHMLAAEGDLVAFYVSFEGTQNGPMGAFPATGKKMSSDCFGFHRIENGKIAETWVTWDNLAAMEQLGLLPPQEAEKTEK
jgi:steroid delta-isomerase-like uncharacterized protein